MINRPTPQLFSPRLHYRNKSATQGRSVRIMVTLSTEAGNDQNLVRGLVAAGMDIARINCAHDDPVLLSNMARSVRSEAKAAKAAKRKVKILIDLGGPKIRTGEITPQPPVLRLKPTRDALGSVVETALLRLSAPGRAPGAGLEATLVVDPHWAPCEIRVKPGQIDKFLYLMRLAGRYASVPTSTGTRSDRAKLRRLSGFRCKSNSNSGDF